MSLRIFLNRINSCVCKLNKADCPTQPLAGKVCVWWWWWGRMVRWRLIQSSKAQIEQKDWIWKNLLFLPNCVPAGTSVFWLTWAHSSVELLKVKGGLGWHYMSSGSHRNRGNLYTVIVSLPPLLRHCPQLRSHSEVLGVKTATYEF